MPSHEIVLISQKIRKDALIIIIIERNEWPKRKKYKTI